MYIQYHLPHRGSCWYHFRMCKDAPLTLFQLRSHLSHLPKHHYLILRRQSFKASFQSVLETIICSYLDRHLTY